MSVHSPTVQAYLFLHKLITDCTLNSTLHRRRSSLPGRRCSCLEQSASARHFCSFSSRLRISAEKPLLLRFLSRTVLNVQCLWSDFVIIRHSNRSSYLLTSMCKSKGTVFVFIRRTGVSFVIIMYHIFCNLSTLQVFIQERVIFVWVINENYLTFVATMHYTNHMLL